MKFSNKKLQMHTMHIYASYKGNDAKIRIQFLSYSDKFFEELTIEVAKEMAKYLDDAIKDAERRALLKEDDEDE